MIQVDPYWLYVCLFLIISLSVITYLLVRSAKEYPPETVEAEAHDFAGVIKDGHGEITLFLWATYVSLIIWAIAYLIQHGHEFLQLGY